MHGWEAWAAEGAAAGFLRRRTTRLELGSRAGRGEGSGPVKAVAEAGAGAWGTVDDGGGLDVDAGSDVDVDAGSEIDVDAVPHVEAV